MQSQGDDEVSEQRLNVGIANVSRRALLLSQSCTLMLGTTHLESLTKMRRLLSRSLGDLLAKIAQFCRGGPLFGRYDPRETISKSRRHRGQAHEKPSPIPNGESGASQ